MFLSCLTFVEQNQKLRDMKKNNEWLEKSLLTMTGADLLNLLRQVISNEHNDKSLMANANDKYMEVPQFVTGAKSLASVLGVSVSTINRMLADGKIDSGCYQSGKVLIFNVSEVLKCLRRDKKK